MAIQLRVKCRGGSALLQSSTCNGFVVEIVIFDHREAFRLLEKLFSGRSNLQYAIIVHIFTEIVGNERLFNDGVPHAVVFHIFGNAKAFQFIMTMSHHLIGGVTHQYVFNIVIAEVLFRFENSLDDLA